MMENSRCRPEICFTFAVNLQAWSDGPMHAQVDSMKMAMSFWDTKEKTAPGATRYLPAAPACSGEEKRICNGVPDLANCRSSFAVIPRCSAVSPHSENSQMRNSLIFFFTNRTDFGLHGSLGPDQVSASWQHTLHLWHFHDVVHGGPMPVQVSIRMWVGA